MKQEKATKSATQFSEIWMRKFLGFIDNYPEEIKTAWLDSLSPEVKFQRDDEIPYMAVYNPWREKRLSMKAGEITFPDYFKTIRNFHEGQPNTNLFGKEYLPYYVLVNIFPILPGHISVVNEKPNDDASINREVTREDLEVMVRLCEDIPGLVLWHNMKGAGASIESWEHFQGIPFTPPVRYAQKKVYDSHSGIFTMPSYPGANIIFNTEQRIERALDMTKKLKGRGRSHTLMIDHPYIYVFEVADDSAGVQYGLNPRSKIGGFETSGAYVAVSRDDFERFSKTGVRVKGVLEKGIAQNNLFNSL